MIRYVHISSEEKCARLSDALWGLAMPPKDRGANVTSGLFPCVNSVNGDCWMQVDIDCAINIHPEAELDGIADILQPWIDSGNLPADTNSNLATLIAANRGGTLTPWQFFPDFFKNASKTQDEMVQAGLFPPPP